MNREEAIKILKQRECCRECVADCTCNECDKAFEMAIEALKQEPEESKDIHLPLYKVGDRIEFDTDGNAYKLYMSNGNEFEQQPCEDCVSREQAQTEIEMNACRYTLAQESGCMGNVEWSDSLIKVSDAVDIIRKLPPVIPKGVTVTDFADKCRECGKMKNGEWIPVSVRLPEDYQRVLVTVVNYWGVEVVRVAEYYNQKKVFRVLENNESWKVVEEGLLAWMPLPKPYKTESEAKE